MKPKNHNEVAKDLTHWRGIAQTLAEKYERTYKVVKTVSGELAVYADVVKLPASFEVVEVVEAL